MAPFASTYAHPAVAMRANQLVSTHGKYLLALPRLVCVSVLAATVGVFFNLMVLIAEVLLKTQGCIHNE